MRTPGSPRRRTPRACRLWLLAASVAGRSRTAAPVHSRPLRPTSGATSGKAASTQPETKAKISATRSRLESVARRRSQRSWPDAPAQRTRTTRTGRAPNGNASTPTPNTRLSSRAVRKRDGGCVNCRSAGRLHVHHVKPWAEYPELRFDPSNLITLCQPCHAEAHRKGVKPRTERRTYKIPMSRSTTATPSRSSASCRPSRSTVASLSAVLRAPRLRDRTVGRRQPRLRPHQPTATQRTSRRAAWIVDRGP